MLIKQRVKMILYFVGVFILGLGLGFILTGFTNTDKNTFWSAVEALGTVGTLIVALTGVILIIEQLKNLQEQSIQHDIAGLEFAFRNLSDNKDYIGSCDKIVSEYESGQITITQELITAFSYVLSKINFVTKITNLGYGKKELLFDAYLPEFFNLSKVVSYLETQENLNLSVLKKLYPYAFEILGEAEKQGREKLNGIDLQLHRRE